VSVPKQFVGKTRIYKLTTNTMTSARCIYTWGMQINVNEKGMITTIAEYSAVNTLVRYLYTVKTGNFAVGEVISPSAKKIFGADG